jgi:acetyl-CoA C-acetyltransferase
MKSENNKAYVLGSARVPFAKSLTIYNDVTRKDLMTASFNALITRYNLSGLLIDDTAIGAVLNSSTEFNLAREVILSTTLDPNSPGYNIQRACGTGLEAVWQLAMKAHMGSIHVGIAGGVDTNSDLPIEVSTNLQKTLIKLSKEKSFAGRLRTLSHLRLRDLKPKIPLIDEPRTHLSMGDHCELMVKEWKISREAQDEYALGSHQKAARAYEQGFFDDLVNPFMGLTQDSTVRKDTTLAQLEKLKPSFDRVSGTLTAGNSSPLTDGSACVLIGNESGAKQLNLEPLAEIIDVQVAGVDFVGGAGLLMAPTKAVAQLLQRNKLTFEDFDFIEIHEAFAGQVLCTLKAWESETYCKDVLGLSKALGSIDMSRLNVVGSSLAVGHPFAATGARIVGTLAKLLSQNKQKRGLISICTAGGMGVAAILA